MIRTGCYDAVYRFPDICSGDSFQRHSAKEHGEGGFALADEDRIDPRQRPDKFLWRQGAHYRPAGDDCRMVVTIFLKVSAGGGHETKLVGIHGGKRDDVGIVAAYGDGLSEEQSSQLGIKFSGLNVMLGLALEGINNPPGLWHQAEISFIIFLPEKMIQAGVAEVFELGEFPAGSAGVRPQFKVGIKEVGIDIMLFCHCHKAGNAHWHIGGTGSWREHQGYFHFSAVNILFFPRQAAECVNIHHSGYKANEEGKKTVKNIYLVKIRNKKYMQSLLFEFSKVIFRLFSTDKGSR